MEDGSEIGFDIGAAVREYVLLALRVDRLFPGVVDTWSGDPSLSDRIRREPDPVPAELVRAADRLAATLPDDLGPARAGFLRGQLRALASTARRLAGQRVPFLDEVEAAFDVRIALGSRDAYRAAHRELDALLPGPAPLSERLAEHRDRDRVPPERLAVAVRALSEALRARTRAVVALPAEESVEYLIVDDAPWSALHHYRGRFRSRVTLNAGSRPRRAQLAQLVAHEAYPGHHTERCRKEAGPVAMGWDEHRVAVANSPQGLMAEGAADLGPQAVIGPGWGSFAAEVLGEVGLGFDGELAERVDAVTAGLARVRQDAALLLHDRQASADQVLDHLRRWLLVDDDRARQVLRFLRHPLWRAYTTTYVEGPALLRGWWERAPSPERYLRLLDEPLTPSAVRAEMATDLATTDGAVVAMSGRPEV